MRADGKKQRARSARRHLTRLARDRSGSTIIYTALTFPVLVGLAGLAIDVGAWYAESRYAQAAADSAAIAGALEILRSDSDPAKVTAAVHDDLAAYDYVAANGATITVHYPPVSGINTGATDSVEVIVARPADRYFSAILLSDKRDIAARAVAMADVNDTCVWSLNPSEQAAINVSGSAQVQLGCGIFVNSNHIDALNEGGSGCLTSTKVKVVGGYTGDCISPTPLTGASPIQDPLASIGPPPYKSACLPSPPVINSGQTVTLSPGTYCSRIKVVSDGTLIFEPGLYVFDGNATLEIGGSATVTGTDVSFYITETNDSELSIAGGANIELSAPADGPLPGILFYHDRNSDPDITHKLSGGSNMDLTGIIYFPNQDLHFTGGSALDAASSLLVADTVTFSGNTDVGGFANNPIFANPLLIISTLVE